MNKTGPTLAYLGLLHVLLLLCKPPGGGHDVVEAGSAHDVEGDEHHVCAWVGQGPHISIVLLASCVTYPGEEKFLVKIAGTSGLRQCPPP